MLRNFTFFAVGRRNNETSLPTNIEFKSLGLEVPIGKTLRETNSDISSQPSSTHIADKKMNSSDYVSLPQGDSIEASDELNNLGFREFLKSTYIQDMIHSKLAQLDDENENIASFASITEFKESFPHYIIGPHDLLEEVSVKYKSKYRYSLCERFLPNTVKAALFLEYLLLVPQYVTNITMSDSNFFDKYFIKNFALPQGSLFALYIIMYTFVTPGAVSVDGVGKIFDSFGHSIWRHLCSFNAQSPKNSKVIDTQANRLKRWFLKGGAFLFTACYLYTDYKFTCQQYDGIDETIDKMLPYSMFSRDILYFSFKFNFWLNVINDPILAFSLCNFLFDKFNINYLNKIIVSDKKIEYPSAEQIDHHIGSGTEQLVDEGPQAPLITKSENENSETHEDQDKGCWDKLRNWYYSQNLKEDIEVINPQDKSRCSIM